MHLNFLRDGSSPGGMGSLSEPICRREPFFNPLRAVSTTAWPGSLLCNEHMDGKTSPLRQRPSVLTISAIKLFQRQYTRLQASYVQESASTSYQTGPTSPQAYDPQGWYGGNFYQQQQPYQRPPQAPQVPERTPVLSMPIHFLHVSPLVGAN